MGRGTVEGYYRGETTNGWEGKSRTRIYTTGIWRGGI